MIILGENFKEVGLMIEYYLDMVVSIFFFIMKYFRFILGLYYEIMMEFEYF